MLTFKFFLVLCCFFSDSLLIQNKTHLTTVTRNYYTSVLYLFFFNLLFQWNFNKLKNCYRFLPHRKRNKSNETRRVIIFIENKGLNVVYIRFKNYHAWGKCNYISHDRPRRVLFLELLSIISFRSQFHCTETFAVWWTISKSEITLGFVVYFFRELWIFFLLRNCLTHTHK